MVATKHEPRYCFNVLQTQVAPNGEYRALIVKENEPGFNLTDWTWGKDFKAAEAIAAKRNATLGLSPDQCQEIVDSSIMAQMRQQGAGRKARPARRQGRPRLTR